MNNKRAAVGKTASSLVISAHCVDIISQNLLSALAVDWEFESKTYAASVNHMAAATVGHAYSSFKLCLSFS